MSSLNRVLNLLKDGEYHKLSEVASSLRMKEEEVQGIIKTLADFGFITYDERRREVRMKPRLREIVLEQEREEPQAVIIFIGEEPYILDLEDLIRFVREHGVRAREPIFL